MQTLALDMDGVVADVYRQFIKMHEAEFGELLELNTMAGKPEAEVFPKERVYVNQPGFFRTVPVMESCCDIVEKLNNAYNLFIVSAATEFPNSLTEKQAWLNEHFPFITWKQIVFCGSKAIIKADIMIDDHFKNLDYFTGEKTILYTQPHNQLSPDGRHHRVQGWRQIEELLLP